MAKRNPPFLRENDVLTFELSAREIGRRDRKTGRWLLRDVSLDIRPGDRLAIAGPSGAGKSLLLRSLALFDPLDAGSVFWNGDAVAGDAVPGFRSQVLYLSQRPMMLDGSVEDALRLPFALAVHRTRRFDRAGALALLGRLARDESFLGKRLRDLSGGEAQIVALARALQLAPAILLLDEPTAALDPAAAEIVEGIIEEWQAEANRARATVWVGHDRAQARRVAERMIVLRDGMLVPDDTGVG